MLQFIQILWLIVIELDEANTGFKELKDGPIDCHNVLRRLLPNLKSWC